VKSRAFARHERPGGRPHVGGYAADGLLRADAKRLIGHAAFRQISRRVGVVAIYAHPERRHWLPRAACVANIADRSRRGSSALMHDSAPTPAMGRWPTFSRKMSGQVAGTRRWAHRYSTTEIRAANAQAHPVQSNKGSIAVAHNGTCECAGDSVHGGLQGSIF